LIIPLHAHFTTNAISTKYCAEFRTFGRTYYSYLTYLLHQLYCTSCLKQKQWQQYKFDS
jgi:hypothetical protein